MRVPAAPTRRGSRLAPAGLSALVLAAGLGATALAWRASAARVEQKLQENFEYRLRDAEARILQRVRTYEQSLRAVSGLFGAVTRVDRAAFRQLVAAIDPARTLPGVQALGYQPLVPAAALDAHLAEVRREGLAGYAVRPAGARAAYAPVRFVEPFTGRNVQVLGFDALAEPARREALERARDLAAPALSAKVTLVQEAGASPVPGAVLYLPVYRGGAAPDGVEARRAALAGWVYVAFRMRDFAEGLFGERAGDLDLEIFDGDRPSPEALFHDSDAVAFTAEPGTDAFSAVRPLAVAGRRWTLATRSLGRFEVRLGADRPRLVAAWGAMASLLLAALAWLLASSRARVKAALQRSESLHQLLMRNFPGGAVGLYDGALRFLLADGAALAGLPPPGDWRGRTLAEVVPPGLVQRLERACRSALAGRTAQEALEHGGRSLEATFHPVHDRAGAVVLGVMLARDVTERQAAQAQRAVVDRLAALGTLIAGLAHEVNNPLAGQASCQALASEALARAQALLRTPGAPSPAGLARLVDEASEELAEAEVGSRRIARLVRDLADIGRADPTRVRAAPAAAVAEAMRSAGGLRRPEVAVRVEDAGAPDVLFAPGQLERVVVNLLANAHDAVPAGRAGTVTVRLGPGEAGGLRLEVQDDGEGIDPAVAGRIFDPFFSTRDVGRGTGLGLSICHAIVTAHGGTIAATGAPGGGTTFRVELPGLPPAPVA